MRSTPRKYNEWVRWYAWRPVRVYEPGQIGKYDYHWAWLEYVERKRAIACEGISINALWIYRDVGTQS